MGYCGPRGIPLHEFLAWPEHSQQAALQWSAHESRRCPSCGTHPEDWAQGTESQHWHQRVCPGCVRKDRAAEGISDGTRGVGLEAAAGPPSACPVCALTS